jgi:DNA-binding NtrC family response regulator
MDVAPAATTPPAKRPILVVDDEPEMLFSLRNLLRREFHVHTAASGAEGIKILETEVVHLVMTDQRMPGMTGVELLRRVKTDHPAAMRLIFTGYADVSAVIAAINHGNVFRFVAKPWDPEELLAVLREAGRRYDQIVERSRLLRLLREGQAQAVAFQEKLRSGEFGTLTPDGAAAGEALVAANRELIDLLDRVQAALPGDAAT